MNGNSSHPDAGGTAGLLGAVIGGLLTPPPDPTSDPTDDGTAPDVVDDGLDHPLADAYSEGRHPTPVDFDGTAGRLRERISALLAGQRISRG